MEPTDGGRGTPQPPTLKELAPHFPQLEILECLGRGGMGVVYKARQKALDRMVALKLLAPERVGDPKFAGRFEHEAKALAALSHPNIVTIHDFGEAGGYFYLLMEFVDGVNLRQATQGGRFTPGQALAIVPPVCEALQYAHDHGVVHRDIKPENLLLDKEGRVKIADFGIATMLGAEPPGVGLAETQPAGTPPYMAPEQKARHATDHRADIYSLGVVLYELLTGEMPSGTLQPPSRKVRIDVRLDEVVLRALESKPELRYQTAGDFGASVETVVGSPAAQGAAEASGRWLGPAVGVVVFFSGFAFLFPLIDILGTRREAAHLAVLATQIIAAVLAGFRAAQTWRTSRGNDEAGLGAWLKTAGWLAWILALPASAFGLFFLLSMLEERGEWNPGMSEAIFVLAVAMGAVLLPWAGWVLLRFAAALPGAAPRQANHAGGSRFSRAAILGACLASLPILAIVLTFYARSATGGESLEPPPVWRAATILLASVLGLAGPFAATILGWKAVADIRRSGGRLRGMWLALADGCLYPAAAVFGLAAWFWRWVFHDVIRNALLRGGDQPSVLATMLIDHAWGFALLAAGVTFGLLAWVAARRLRTWVASISPLGTGGGTP